MMLFQFLIVVQAIFATDLIKWANQNERSVRIEDLANDMQYLKDRLAKVENEIHSKKSKETDESFPATDSNNFQLNMILGSSSMTNHYP